MYRFALTGLVGVWLSGCSTDASRFAEGGNPFSNPFTSTGNTAAPTPRVSATPLASAGKADPSYAAAAHPAPVAVAALPASAPVGGSAVGWSAVGGTPIVVGSADDLDGLSRRYGVPTAALLSANGLRSGSEIRAGMRIVVPVYNERGHAVAESEKPEHRRIAEADEEDRKPSKAKAHKAREDADDADESDGARKHRKTAKADRDAEREPKSEREARADREGKAGREAKADREEKTDREAKADRVKAEKKEKADKSDRPEKSAKADRSEKAARVEKSDKADKSEKVAKADPPKADRKKAAADMTQTGAVTPAAPAKDEASKQADAAASGPEFRWPARGRIIQGFKTGGNEGINIAVPEGTSVRAAEDGKVAYAGNALKGYGNLVLIRHPNGFVTAYANNGELNVKIGDTVKRGQVIAKSGQSGDVNSPQLHFELRKGQTPVDPTSYLAGL